MIHTIIVEDDAMVAKIGQSYIAQFENFVVDGVFPNGAEALDYLLYHPVDLVILDVYMPVMDGKTLLQRMRSAQIESEVIMVTAAAEMSTLSQVLHLGILDYLIKPYSFHRFAEAIQKFTHQKTLLGGATMANQQLVDKLMHVTSLETQGELQKGLNSKTLEIVSHYLSHAPNEKHTCDSISLATKLSKVTVRRYLNYLIDAGKLTSSIDYETGGRPRVLYRWL